MIEIHVIYEIRGRRTPKVSIFYTLMHNARKSDAARWNMSNALVEVASSCVDVHVCSFSVLVVLLCVLCLLF